MKSIILCADGGSRGNPGPAACAFVLYGSEIQPATGSSQITNFELWKDSILTSAGVYLDETTNNVAEWQGVLKGLQRIEEMNLSFENLHILLDSELVVKQILGIYKVKQPHLKPFYDEVKKLIHSLEKKGKVQIAHIYREYNKQADKLVNEVLDSK